MLNSLLEASEIKNLIIYEEPKKYWLYKRENQSFIKSLETNKKKKTKEQKIIFWGETNYENIINNYIA